MVTKRRNYLKAADLLVDDYLPFWAELSTRDMNAPGPIGIKRQPDSDAVR